MQDFISSKKSQQERRPFSVPAKGAFQYWFPFLLCKIAK